MGILDPFYRLDALTSSFQPSDSTLTGGPSSQSPPQSPRSSTSISHSISRVHHPTSRLSFANSVVSKPSTDFIRAANSAQAAVYTVSQTNSDKPGELEKAEIKRKMVALATPLKKGVRGGGVGNGTEREARKPRKSKVGTYLSTDNDPELPLRAALKLVDMYPDAVSTKLRNEILEKIEAAQQHSNETTALMKPKREARGEVNASESLRQLEEDIRQLEAEYAELKRKTDAMMKARTAQQFAEADESMASNGSPLLQHTARKNARDAPKSHHGDLTSRLLGVYADDADVTTDFRNLVQGDASLLLEGDTPDISQLMAQTPMKPASSGNWERPRPATQVEPPAKPQHVPLASLRMRGAENRPAPPRTPPRREEDSFEDTPRAGYTFEAPEKDDSLEEPEDATVLLGGQSSPLATTREDSPQSPPVSKTDQEPDVTVESEPKETFHDEGDSEMDAIGMKLFTMKLWTLAGDVLHPGNNYDIGKGNGTEPVPSFYQTKFLLKSICDETASPSATTEEIHRTLTAILLYHLVSRDPNTVAEGEEFQAGMNETKEMLSQALDARGWKQEHGNKVIFKWVAKKLLKSEGGRRLRCNLD